VSATTAEVRDRRTVIRKLLISGLSKPEIVELLSLPYADKDSGRIITGATADQLAHDFRALARETMGALTTIEGAEEALADLMLQARGITSDARAAGDFGPAIQGVKLQLMLLGLRQPAIDWRDRRSATYGAEADPESIAAAARAKSVRGMSDADLLRELADRRARTDRQAMANAGPNTPAR
jgi:hypothetical protein